MSFSPLISYIIPCYNSSQYIKKCLDSFEGQTVPPYEIVIVDDCSNDDSLKVIENYKRNSKLNIIVLENERNLGPSLSRKRGIDFSSGDYIAFADSDDWLEAQANETIIDSIRCGDPPELVLFDYYVSFSNGKKYKNNRTKTLIDSSKPELIARTNTSLWSCCVKKDIFSDILFPDLKHEEDAIILFQVIKKVSNYKILEEHLYNYFFREESLSKKASKTLFLDEIRAFEEEKKILSVDYPSELEFLGVRLIAYSASLYAFRAKIPFKQIKSFNEEFDKDFPEWENNRYLSTLGTAKRVFLWLVRHRFFLLGYLISKFHHILAKIKVFFK